MNCPSLTVMTYQRESWSVVLICAAGFGIGLGIMYVLDLLLMIFILGNKKFQSVFGVSMVFRSCCSLVIGPIGGEWALGEKRRKGRECREGDEEGAGKKVSSYETFFQCYP